MILFCVGVDRCSVKAKVKPDIPTEPPKYGLGSNRDWIKVNAVKVIKTKANKTGCPKKKRRYVTKKNYGKLPVYLETRIRTAAEIKKRDSPEEQAKCRHDGTRKLDEKERMEMVNNLKLKWAHTNAAYQKLSFVLDTNSKKLRKERFERNLTNIEKDVTLLCRKVVLVSDSAPAKIRQESTGSMH
ncbi:unnamed protein product [Sphagnum jensenii]|uniref:Enkurin domain-containing protein n=1 Tax=Sphagnum jensenii TaxID=128206 RepID=A0ABP0X3Z7_9BRYO